MLGLSPFTYIWLFALAVLGVLGLVAYFVVSGMVSEISTKATKIAELERTIQKHEAKLLAESGRIERRDRAIAASKCKDSIEDWIRHPEKLPEPFDPFNQFNK